MDDDGRIALEQEIADLRFALRQATDRASLAEVKCSQLLESGRLTDDVYDLRKKVESLKTCEAWLQKQVAERDETIAELNAALSRGWHWTDENLPGIDGRLLISVGGSCREGFYRNGKFTDKYGDQEPEAWMSLPMAPRYRNGQYVGY